MKVAISERRRGNMDMALKIIDTALLKYPEFAKFYMMQGQIHEAQGNVSEARAAYLLGTQNCPENAALWILAANMDGPEAARELLDTSRRFNPFNEILWAESAAVERRIDGDEQAMAMVVRGLQRCLTSGLLWSLSIILTTQSAKQARFVEALQTLPGDPHILCSVARHFWAQNKSMQARNFFTRIFQNNNNEDLGDLWAWWLKFERDHGTLVSGI